MPREVRWCIGEPLCGKTSLALEYIRRDCESTGFPALVIDSMHAKNFRDKPHAQSVREVVDTVWRDGRHCYFWPRGEEEFNAVMAAALDGWRCHILIDEAHIWMDNRRFPESIGALMRGTQHWMGTLTLTTQFYGDVGRKARAMSPVFEIFKCPASDDVTLAEIHRVTGFTPEQVSTLEKYKHLTFDPNRE